MPSFPGVDYLELDSLLSSEERMIRDTFRRFVDEEILPTIAGHFRNGTFPRELPKKLGALGALGASLDGYGCAGLGPNAYGLLLSELERGDSGVRSFASVQGSLVMWPIYTYGSDEQKEKWLPRLRAGEAIGCFGLTEPDFGSNPGGMLTTAKPHADGWILNGSKRWITSGTLADVALVWARTPEGIAGFLVERGTPGFSAHDIPGKFSMRASVTSELVLEDCVVPKSAQLPLAKGLRAPLSCLDQARFGIMWGSIGAASACYEEALRYCKERAQFGKPIAGHQLVQEKLVDMLGEITAAQLYAFRLGQLKAEGKARAAQISLGKRNCVRTALRAARMARELLGGNGITDEYQCGRHLCNLETVYTYEGTDHIHTLIVGQDITGIAAFQN